MSAHTWGKYLDVDEVNFISSGGINAGYYSYGTQFAMDNLTITDVPEPTVLALIGLGATILMVCRRRQR